MLAEDLLTLDVNNATRYYRPVVIKDFADKATEQLWHRLRVRTMSAALQKQARRKLVMIHSAENLQDLRSPPGNRLEALSGDREGQHSVRINDQFRVCFRWQDGDAYEVEVTDYH